MLKRLAILAVVGALATVGVLASQDVAKGAPKDGVVKREAGKKGQVQPQAQGNDQSAPNPPPATLQPITPSCDEACQQGRENLKIQNRLSWLTGGLVLVGLLQVASMIWQAISLRQTRTDIHTQAGIMDTQAQDARVSAKDAALTAQSTLDAIKRQSDSMERQIALQETLNQQWLEIRGWRREGEGSREEIPPKFSVASEIVNPTNMPLTIDVINVAVRTTTETFGGGNELAPGESIKIAFPIIVESDSDLGAYNAYRLILRFYGSIEYTDAFKKKQEQPFSCTGVFGPVIMPSSLCSPFRAQYEPLDNSPRGNAWQLPFCAQTVKYFVY